MPRYVSTPIALLCLTFACQAAKSPPANSPSIGKVHVALTPQQELERAELALEAGRYAEAEAAYVRAGALPALEAQAAWGLRRVHFITGRYELAAVAPKAPIPDPGRAAETLVLRAQALMALGQYDAALDVVKTSEHPGSRRLHGELLILQGKRDEATPILMSIIEDYNEGRIEESDALGLALVGRAAHLLRSPEDANEAYNLAEQAAPEAPIEMLLWRVELFLNHHDPGHAEEVLDEILERSPTHPDALVWLANVKLEQALDFDEARRLVHEALTINSRHARAYAVLAGLALRDMKLEEATTHVERGLTLNDRHLELLSLKGAIRFLADDAAGFARVRDEVLGHNREYSEFYTIVGLYAEWEHRYDEIVKLMQRAVTIDGQDAKAHAQLGLNLIRGGDDTAGLFSLREAFSLDPYNVRVYNTLNLYEKVIPKDYTDVASERFRFRYPTREKPVLERFVPPLLTQAWEKMVENYAFEPQTPVGIELYAERENFAIRTSGLPHTAIQGVCFGQTLASMSPYYEKFNVGMTLWHELAHVFHIQLSKNHVPRWFTEGLAEYETLLERREWSREHDVELYHALRDGRLPKVGAMNEAFTRAEDIADIAVAYYASTQIVRLLAETYGHAKLREMLVLWGQGKRTDAVVQTALGVTTADLDRQFEAYLSKRLARYQEQFVPERRVGNPERVREHADANRDDPDALGRFALVLVEAGDGQAAARIVKEILRLEPNHAQGLWLQARLALRSGDGADAAAAVARLLAAGKDGYETQLLQSKAAQLLDDDALMEASLRRAQAFDPTQAEAVYGLLELARKAKDKAAERRWLRELVVLEEHNGAVFRTLVHSLISKKETATPSLAELTEAVDVGLSAVYADMHAPASHVAYALALEANGRQPEATAAFETALVAPGSDGDRARALREYAEYQTRHGNRAKARKLEQEALKVEQEVTKSLTESEPPEADVPAREGPAESAPSEE